jgi:hypothetical protein
MMLLMTILLSAKPFWIPGTCILVKNPCRVVDLSHPAFILVLYFVFCDVKREEGDCNCVVSVLQEKLTFHLIQLYATHKAHWQMQHAAISYPEMQEIHFASVFVGEMVWGRAKTAIEASRISALNYASGCSFIVSDGIFSNRMHIVTFMWSGQYYCAYCLEMNNLKLRPKLFVYIPPNYKYFD